MTDVVEFQAALGNIQWVNDPSLPEYIYDDSSYKESSYITELKKANREFFGELGVKLLKINRFISNLFGDKAEKTAYDNLIKNSRINPYKKKKLYKFFSDMGLGRADDTDFIAIFEASFQDRRNFLQLLGIKGHKSDPLYKWDDDNVTCAKNMINCLEELVDKNRHFMDFRSFVDVFGLVPFDNFDRGMSLLMSLTGYSNYAEFFSACIEDFSEVCARV